MKKIIDIMKDEDGIAGLFAIGLAFLITYACISILLFFIPEAPISKSDIIYAETSEKIYPAYKDTLYAEFEEVRDIPFEDLIVTIVPAKKTESKCFNENEISIYPVVDISQEVLSTLGLTNIIEEKYKSVAVKDLVLVLLSETSLK